MKKLFGKIPGVLFCFIVSLAALGLAHFFPHMGHISLALILGILIANLIPLKASLQPGSSFCEKKILECAIALFGLNMTYQDLSFLSPGVVISLVLMVCLVILVSFFVGRFLGFSSSFSFLIGVGNGVCGSAAIMATSKLIKAPKKDIVLSLTIIHILGISSLFILPALFSGLEDFYSTYIIGGSLQAMGHVVASTTLLDPHMANVAIAVKMIRILCLTPLILILCFLFPGKKTTREASKMSFPVPVYIFIFCFFVFLTNAYGFTDDFRFYSKKLSHFLLSLAMVGLGSGIKFKDLQKGFGKNTAFGLFVFIGEVAFLYYAYGLFLA